MTRFLFGSMFFFVSMLAFSEEAITWEVHTGKPSFSFLLAAERQMIEQINRNSEGSLKFILKDRDDLIDPKGSYNAVRTGEIDAMLMNPVYWSPADPVFAIIGDLVAAWDSPNQYSKWLKAGGIDYLERAYQRVGLKLLGYVVAPSESLVSTKPITSIDDMKGFVMRAPPGMINEFFNLLGVRTRNMSSINILKSLENGRIDMADFSDLYINNQLGVYRFAKHTTYPGIHSIPLYDFVTREEAWNKLSTSQQTVVLEAIEDWKISVTESYKELLKTAEADVLTQGVTLHRWNDVELKKAKQVAMVVWEKYANKSDEAKKLLEDIQKWLEMEGNQK